MTSSTIRGACVCRLEGPLDMTAADDLRSHLFQIQQSEAKAVVLNMENVAFISSVCLSALFSFRTAVVQDDGKVAICGLTPTIHKLFKVARLDELFTIAPSEDAAIDAVTG